MPGDSRNPFVVQVFGFNIMKKVESLKSVRSRRNPFVVQVFGFSRSDRSVCICRQVAIPSWFRSLASVDPPYGIGQPKQGSQSLRGSGLWLRMGKSSIVYQLCEEVAIPSWFRSLASCADFDAELIEVDVAIPSWFRSLASCLPACWILSAWQVCRNPFVVQVFGFDCPNDYWNTDGLVAIPSWFRSLASKTVA